MLCGIASLPVSSCKQQWCGKGGGLFIIFDPVLLLAKFLKQPKLAELWSFLLTSYCLQLQLGLFWPKVRVVQCAGGKQPSTQTSFCKSGPSFNSLFLRIIELRILRPAVSRPAQAQFKSHVISSCLKRPTVRACTWVSAWEPLGKCRVAGCSTRHFLGRKAAFWRLESGEVRLRVEEIFLFPLFGPWLA